MFVMTLNPDGTLLSEKQVTSPRGFNLLAQWGEAQSFPDRLAGCIALREVLFILDAAIDGLDRGLQRDEARGEVRGGRGKPSALPSPAACARSSRVRA